MLSNCQNDSKGKEKIEVVYTQLPESVSCFITETSTGKMIVFNSDVVEKTLSESIYCLDK